MGFKTNHIERLNELLAVHGININMHEKIIKKHSAVVNESMRILARSGTGVPMYLIMLAMDVHFDLKWFCTSVLDTENKRLIKDELIDVYDLPEERSIAGLLDDLM